MSTHDPMCPQPAYDKAPCPRCVLIARVRADESERLRDAVKALPRIAAVSRGTGAYVPCVQLSDVLVLLDEEEKS